MSDRIRELVDRLVAPGPKCCAVSASECHEIHDEVVALLAEVARREVCWSCPDCAFTYAAYHVLADGSHVCPVCEAEQMRKDADDQTVIAYRLMKQRDEALALMERYRAVAVASLALRVTESTDVPGESIAEIEGNVTAAQARTGRALRAGVTPLTPPAPPDFSPTRS